MVNSVSLYYMHDLINFAFGSCSIYRVFLSKGNATLPRVTLCGWHGRRSTLRLPVDELLVAIDRAVCSVCVETVANQDARSAMASLRGMQARAPFGMRTLLAHHEHASPERKEGDLSLTAQLDCLCWQLVEVTE